MPGPVSVYLCAYLSNALTLKGMGPYMPGLRPGLAGFGGPIGPVSDVSPPL
jgi:hypothetical protein